jgi:hypothetical protein
MGAELGDGGVDDGLSLAVGQALGAGEYHYLILHRLVYFFKKRNYTV